MAPFVWHDRLVKLDGEALMFSAKGDPDNWEFFPAKPNDDMAIAMTLDGRIYGAHARPDGTLGIETGRGLYILNADRWSECIVQAEDPAQRGLDRREAEEKKARVREETEASIRQINERADRWLAWLRSPGFNDRSTEPNDSVDTPALVPAKET